MIWLYETPWWLPTGLAVIGITFFITSNNRQNPRGRLAGVILVCLAILLATASRFLESDREIVTRRSRELVQAVVSADPKRMAAYMDDQVSAPPLHGKDQVSSTAKGVIERFGVDSATTTSVDAQMEGDDEAFAVIQVYVSTQKNGPALTRWKLRWQKEGKQWLLTDVTPLEVPGNPASLGDLLK